MTMDNNLNELISKLTDFLKTEAKTETVVGQQFQLGDFQCVPVIGIGLGLGVGGGEAKIPSGAGVGGGAGIGIGPLGFLVTKDSEIQFIPTRTSRGLSAAFEKIPDLMEKYLDKNSKKEEQVSS